MVGGRGLFETSAELRCRFTERWGGVGFVDTGLVTENGTLTGEVGLPRRRRRRRALLHRHRRAARRPGDAGHPARRGRLRRALHRDRTGVLRRLAAILGLLALVAIAAVAQDAAEPEEQRRLPRQPARAPALDADAADPAARHHRRAVVAGAHRADHHLRPERRLARDRQRRDRLEPARAAARPGQRQPAERRARSPGCAAPSRRRRPAPPLPERRGAAVRAARAAGVDRPRRARARRASSFAEPVFGQAARISRRRLAEPGAAACSTTDLAVAPPRRPGRRADAAGRLLERDPAARRRPRPARAAGRPGRDAAPHRGRAGDRPDRRRARGRSTTSTSPSRSTPAAPASPSGARRAARRATRASASTSTSAASSRRWCPPRLPRLLRRREHGAGAAASARPAAACGSTTLALARRGAAARRRPRDRRRRLPARPDADRHARRPGRRRRWCCRCRAARTRLQSAVLHVNFGDASRWNGLVVLDRLEAADIAMEDVTLRLGGLAQNLEDPARRNVTVNVEGLATGVWSADPEVAARARQPHRPLRRRRAAAGRRRSRSASCSSAATASRSSAPASIADCVYTGRNAVRVADLAIFAGLAGRDARRRDRPARRRQRQPAQSGGFDLDLRRRRHRPRARRRRASTALLAGETTLSGRAVRDETGFRTENLRLENPQLSFASNGAGLEHAAPTSASTPASPTSRRSTRGSAAR